MYKSCREWKAWYVGYLFKPGWTSDTLQPRNYHETKAERLTMRVSHDSLVEDEQVTAIVLDCSWDECLPYEDGGQ
jgi:hypothetical protein